MGDPLLVGLGINLGSTLMYNAFGGQLRARLTGEEARIASEAARIIQNRTGCKVSTKTVRQTMFEPSVWRSLLCGATPDEWNAYLFDLVPPAANLTGEDVADMLVAALRDHAGTELSTTLAIFDELRSGGASASAAHDATFDMLVAMIDGAAEHSHQLASIEDDLAAMTKAIELLAAADGGGRTFSGPIQRAVAQLDQAVDELTVEQYRVIKHLQGKERALVYGAPGSGKTLVAAEKANRVAEAGFSVLLLCHSPHLASWLQQLTAGTSVVVHWFADLVSQSANGTGFDPTSWSGLHEPTSEQLGLAFDQITAGPPPFQVAIVDEGQDFRPDWWTVVDALVGERGTLYVFGDEAQSLHRGRDLPQVDASFDLTRNCRNSGAVYAIMRAVSSALPGPEARLADLGRAHFAVYERGVESAALASAIGVLGPAEAWGSAAIVYCGSLAAHPLPPASFTKPVTDWRASVARTLSFLFDASRGLPRWNAVDLVGLVRDVPRLSWDPLPSAVDEEAVRAVGRAWLDAHPDRPSNSIDPEVVRQLVWSEGGGVGPRYQTPELRPVLLGAIAEHFASGAWLDEIEEPIEVVVHAHDTMPHDAVCDRSVAVPSYGVDRIKGLEARTVIALWDGDGVAPLAELLVATSRAKGELAIAVSRRSVLHLPSSARELFQSAIPIGARADPPGDWPWDGVRLDHWRSPGRALA